MSQPEFKIVPKPEMSAEDRAINRLADAVHRLNEAVQRAVEAGISIELVRVSRFHDGSGNWGDQMVPLVRAPAAASEG
ncbi:hypothetical protein [Bosea sp. (in: a-proteobacteria)]|uniref:hypothetical protein n=1 Tax=Bosea sp. (in: a-proteobacteria) TaxID=1871050 RepID=UPI003340712D